MNLILAFFWMALAIALVIYERTSGDTRFTIRGTNISFTWLLVLLAVYNLFRWWGIRSYQAEQRALRNAEANRERLRDQHREPIGNPDPNFNFTDEPPAPNRNVTDQPPSKN